MLLVQFPTDFPINALIEFAAEHSLMVRRSSSELVILSRPPGSPTESQTGAGSSARKVSREA